MAGRATKTHQVTVKLTADQHRAVKQRAERCGLSDSAWARVILVQAATRPATDGRLHLKEPDGTLI